MKNFKEDLYAFSSFLKSSESAIENKKYYLKMIKKYHPDTASDTQAVQLNECMILINYVYSRSELPLTRSDEGTVTDDYEAHRTNGKYEFINRYNIKQREKDKIIFVYKMGLDLILHAQDTIVRNSISYGYDAESTNTAIAQIYSAMKHLNYVIKNSKTENWTNEAKDKMQWAYKMNANISKNMTNSISKDIALT